MSSRFPVVNVSQFPRLTLDIIPAESQILSDRIAKLKALWLEYDPPLAAAYDVETTEFDPIVINQEVNTNFEIIERSRLNAFGQATTLAFAWGNNLDAIASRYPTGVPRLEGESDDQYRRRIWLSPNVFNSAGAEDAYVFWALTTVLTLRDATATMVRRNRRDDPVVHVTLLRSGDDPHPTVDEIEQVRSVLHRPDIKPLTDVVVVHGPAVKNVSVNVRYWLYPAFDRSYVEGVMYERLDAMIVAQNFLGVDLTLQDIYAATEVPGVWKVEIVSPIEDTYVEPTGVVKVADRKLDYIGRGE